MRFCPALLALAVCAFPEDAPKDAKEERLPLRVISINPVVVDRGTRDGLAVGDGVTFSPRGGGSYGGVVIEVNERSAVIELHDARFVPEPGTRGEVRIPKQRFEGSGEPGKPETKGPEEKEERSPWKNRDRDWKPGMPLLKGVPRRPEDRALDIAIRVYLRGAVTQDVAGDFHNSLLRTGADVIVKNAFGRGGRIRFDGEISVLSDADEDSMGLDVLVRRLSYAWGDHRFSTTRWEVGRFLQHGMPEFGVLDGAEWSRRRENGDRYGISVGFMPEPDDDFESLSDLQIAVFYQWVADVREEMTVGVGFQKTWHDGASDRDLMVVKLRRVPKGTWHAHATVWLDFANGFSVTQAVASLNRRFSGGDSIAFTYTRILFPDLLRNEFLPVSAEELANGHHDRLAADGGIQLAVGRRLRGHVSAWTDEDGNGGTAEVGLEFDDLFLDHSHTEISLFGALAQFENTAGVRIVFGRTVGTNRWDVLYEIGNHHRKGFPDDRDDIIQQRLRASGNIVHSSGWDISIYAEGVVWDEVSWSVGFYLQKRFR